MIQQEEGTPNLLKLIRVSVSKFVSCLPSSFAHDLPKSRSYS